MNNCRVEQETNAYDAELSRRENDDYKLAEAAKKTLDAIDKYAAEMMDGEVFQRGNAVGILTAYSLRDADYTGDKLFPAIELKLSSSTATPESLLSAVNELRALQYRYCRGEVALYLGEKNDELEALTDLNTGSTL